MLWLGLQLVIKGGREAILRLVLIALAVMIGVTLLLSVLAGYQAFQHNNAKPQWWWPDMDSNGTIMWVSSTEGFRGKDIKRIEIAAPSPNSLAIPGLMQLPKPGELYVSPALDKLMRSVSADQLANRFHGRRVGIIHDPGLQNANELVAVSGRSLAELQHAPQAYPVSRLPQRAPSSIAQTGLWATMFVATALAILFPIVVLIATATRLSASRREERYAAMRLAGATPRQISLIASADAFLGAAIGTVLGIGGFMLVRAVVGQLLRDELPFFPADITPTLAEYALIIVAVPAIAVLFSRWSLRRVSISPLGVSRKSIPQPPNLLSLIPLLLGIAVFIPSANAKAGAALGLGVGLVMIGLITAGPLLTLYCARLLSRTVRGAVGLLAARRLGSNPRIAFKAVSGIVLAAFVGTAFAGIASFVITDQQRPQLTALDNIMTVGFYASHTAGLPASEGAHRIRQLESQAGTEAFPVYSTPSSTAKLSAATAHEDTDTPIEGYIDCADLQAIGALGQCPVGVEAIAISTMRLISDRESGTVVRPGAATTTRADLKNLPVQAMLIRTTSLASTEKAHTLLVAQTPVTETPRTFGDVRQRDIARVALSKRIFYSAVLLTALVAACSLAVALTDGLMERKRPFTLLRLSGVPVSTLNRTVLLESLILILLAAVIGALAGYAVAAVIVKTVPDQGASIGQLGTSYYMTMGGSLLVTLAVMCLPLPLLKRITRPQQARFE